MWSFFPKISQEFSLLDVWDFSFQADFAGLWMSHKKIVLNQWFLYFELKKCSVLDATVYCGNVDEKVEEALLWELFLQAGPVGRS